MHGYCARMIIITAQRSYASAVLGVVILSVRLSVCLSHACFVTNPKKPTGDIVTPLERAILLVFATQQWLVDDVPFHVKWAIEVTHPLQISLMSTNFRL